MIRSKEQYRKYLEADRINLGCTRGIRDRLLHDVWRFQRLLRKAEYYTNCTTGIFARCILLAARLRLKRLGIRLGFTIPLNVFGPGLSIAHAGTIVVNENARVGANCRLHACVNIGASGGSSRAPRLGNNIYIAPGAKIFGDISIADNVAIGGNAVVNCSCDEPDVTIGGIPARKISDKGSREAGWNPCNTYLG